MTDNNNSWSEWSRHVLIELERLNDNITKIFERIEKTNLDIQALKIKAGVWGFIAGAMPVMITIGLKLINIY